jgi:hypothetical protein
MINVEEPGEAVTMTQPERSSRAADPGHARLRELARQQGVRPIRSAEDLAADGAFESDEELEEFLVAYRKWRRAETA